MRNYVRLFVLTAVAVAAFAVPPAADAQSYSPTLDSFTRNYPLGTCKDPWVTEVVTRIKGSKPFGQGDSGECNHRLYGGGHWSNYADLENKVRQAVSKWRSTQRQCRDAWVTKAITEVTGYAPADSGELGDCNMWNWRDGKWRSYEDLRAAVAEFNARFVNMGFKIQSDGRRVGGGQFTGLMVQPNGQILADGKVLLNPSQYAFKGPNGQMVAAGAGNILSHNGAQMVAAGAGNLKQTIAKLVGSDGGSIVGNAGGNMVAAGAGNLVVKFPDGSMMLVKK